MCGALHEARPAFDDLCESGIRDVVSWNSIVVADVQGGDAKNAVKMLIEWLISWNLPDSVSIVNILLACPSMGACL